MHVLARVCVFVCARAKGLSGVWWCGALERPPMCAAAVVGCCAIGYLRYDYREIGKLMRLKGEIIL